MAQKNETLLTRRVAKVLPSPTALSQLLQKEKIRVYIGIDPTGGRLHLGHAIGIRKLMEFAEAGHEAILLFGTGTVLVGDPSLRTSARDSVTEEEIAANISRWRQQVAPIVNFDKVTIKENGEWITGMSLKEFIGIAAHISAIQLFKRDSFTRRLKGGDTVWYHETMYPLLQGYDSVVMDVDLEIGGTDQEFNMLVGRELQRKLNQREKYVLTTPMIMGTDGQQMSKTTGNCVWLDDSPEEMFGKLMSIPDAQILPYFELTTDLTEAELAEVKTAFKTGTNPRDLKLRLAEAVVALWHTPKQARAALKAWEKQFSQGELPDEIETVKLEKSEWELVELLVETGLATSKSQAKRLMNQGGVKLNQTPCKTDSLKLKSGDIIQVGKRKFKKVEL